MTRKLEYLDQMGWKITCPSSDKYCFFCAKSLSVPFFYCKKEDFMICEECNKGFLRCEQADYKHNHIHYKISIWKIENDNKIAVILALIFMKLFYILRRA